MRDLIIMTTLDDIVGRRPCNPCRRHSLCRSMSERKASSLWSRCLRSFSSAIVNFCRFVKVAPTSISLSPSEPSNWNGNKIVLECLRLPNFTKDSEKF